MHTEDPVIILHGYAIEEKREGRGDTSAVKINSSHGVVEETD